MFMVDSNTWMRNSDINWLVDKNVTEKTDNFISWKRPLFLISILLAIYTWKHFETYFRLTPMYSRWTFSVILDKKVTEIIKSGQFCSKDTLCYEIIQIILITITIFLKQFLRLTVMGKYSKFPMIIMIYCQNVT